MRKTPALTMAVAAALTATMAAQDARMVIADASRAMGMTDLNAIVLAGTAAIGNFGQSRTISFGLASTTIRNYTHTIDFTQPASRATGLAAPPTSPGAPPPSPRTFDDAITPANAGWAQQLEIWVTPWGFLRGAASSSNATVRSQRVDGVSYKVVTWTPAQKAPSGQSYKVVGYIGPDLMVARVETWVEHPIVGDMHVETRFTDYRDFGGLKAPARIARRQVGMETFVAAITNVRPNPPDLARLITPAPTSVVGGVAGYGDTGGSAAPAASEKLADGVYRITGGYVALAVEFRDHIVVLEGAQSEARGLAVIAETKRLFPGKRIKYVVNTHPHFDHAAGLAPFAAEGSVVLTDDNSRYFVEQALRSPRTLVGDVLARSRRKPTVEGVVEKMILTDDTRTIELHHVQKLEHSDAMLVAYLPKEKILFTADFNPPGPGQPVDPAIATLVQNIERLGLAFERHVMVHPPDPDRPMSRADLLALAQRSN